ncbi:MAG: hypothetical protein JSU89_09885 [Myxococcales bacterium]|nr:MAG: hypothetical protein JSU89_09885 [Myxococcales bacterium]
MKQAPSDELDTGAVAGRLDELSRVVRSGRLVRLLKGEGLSKSTVEELLRPESLLALRGILTDRLSGTEEE